MFASLFARQRRIAPPLPKLPRFRPQFEVLEARDVPATLHWLGGDSVAPTSMYRPMNWDIGRPPEAGDDLIFDGAYSNFDCTDLTGLLNSPGSGGSSGGGPGPGGGGSIGGGPTGGGPNSLHLVNHYARTVTVVDNFPVNVLELASPEGAISQPLVFTDNSISVATSFNWTGGTLNSSSYLNTIHLLGGSTTTVTPPTTDLTTGDVLRFEDGLSSGSTGTFNEGTVNFNNGSYFAIEALSLMTSINAYFVQPAPAVSTNKGTLLIRGGGTDKKGLLRNEGTVTIKDDTIANFYEGDAEHDSYYQWDGNTQIENGSTLKVNAASQAYFGGGKLSTLAVSVGAQIATIDGDLVVHVTDVVICDW